MKGQETFPWMSIEATTTMLLILAVTLGSQGLTNTFVKQEALDVKVDRVQNTVTSLSSMPKGFIELNMDGYGIKVDENNISMNRSGENVSSIVDPSMINMDLDGPDEYENLDGNLCIRKTSSTISVEPGSC